MKISRSLFYSNRLQVRYLIRYAGRLSSYYTGFVYLGHRSHCFHFLMFLCRLRHVNMSTFYDSCIDILASPLAFCLVFWCISASFSCSSFTFILTCRVSVCIFIYYVPVDFFSSIKFVLEHSDTLLSLWSVENSTSSSNTQPSIHKTRNYNSESPTQKSP